MSGGVPAGEALGDLPSRIQGWIGKARARGGDRIELDFATVELLVRLALRATPIPPIEGRDADVERVVDPAPDEDWLTDVIDDSLDMDWTGRVGARAIIAAWGQRHGR